MCVRRNVDHMRQLINISDFLLFGCRYSRTVSCLTSVPDAGFICVLLLFVERSTSITTSHKSRGGTPSIRSPASNGMISDSPELWDTDVCFLHIQLMVTNVRLPRIPKIPPPSPKLILSSEGRQQNLSLGIMPVDNAEPCCPRDNIAGSHLCDDCVKSILPNACHKLVSI